MNKTEFVNKVSLKSGITKKECKLCLETILEVIQDALKKGQTVTLSNFGIFKLNEVKSKPMFCFKSKLTENKNIEKNLSFKASSNLKQILK